MKNPFYLFLSVDLVGSTSYKSKVPSSEWVKTMMTDFYTKLRNELVGECAKKNLDLKLWKFLGDEILFYLNLQKPEDVAELINAIAIVSNKSRTDFSEKKLDVKFGIWISKIDGPDVIFQRVETSGKDPIVDFIGPNVDTGFRLLKFASPHRLVIDINVAAFMLSEYGGSSFSREIYFEGLHELKGVLSGVPYPVFWVNLSNKQENIELILSQKTKVNLTVFKEYVTTFAKKNCGATFEVILNFKES